MPTADIMSSPVAPLLNKYMCTCLRTYVRAVCGGGCVKVWMGEWVGYDM